MMALQAELDRIEARYGCWADLSIERTIYPDRYRDQPLYRVTLAGGELAYSKGRTRDFVSEDPDEALRMAQAWAEKAHAKWLEQHAPEAVQ